MITELRRSHAKAHVRQVTTIFTWSLTFPPDCSVLEASVKQTPIGDKYFINETLREPKTENISQVIMVGSPFFHKINELLLIKIPFPQITKSKTSVTVQGDYKKWQTRKTEKGSRHATELEEILEKVKGEDQKMTTKCTDCKEGDRTCNCTVEVRRENEFDVLILLDTEKGLKWCPSSTVDSNYFNCHSGNFKKIRANQVCDSFGDCPEAEDESRTLCQSSLLKVLICAVVLFVYGLALALVGCYSCRGQKSKTKKTENRQYRKEQGMKKSQGLKEIQKITDENKQLKKGEITKRT